MISADLLQRLCRARERLQSELEPPARISSVARDAGLATPHFITQFSAVFGETPVQCRTRARLERACDLLRRSDEPVSQVALALGFANLGSFSRLFTRRFGVPPRTWRRQAAPPGVPAGCIAVLNAACLAQRNSGEVPARE
ncbi:helix-turn-helix domain-containing protein [Ramlibacter pallidus]|uniref:Helix-turn-helix transcriptional regulator n=1 Tax=Ramlibacter pallidus TaxID=2780087 RepID=A0ABR9SAM9_9BURK|nr:AraC family transcriptional regulator [Ramlibacter pallidus]MBE7370022.1 helix-turn-helix transcriptional regulator [Ramlibacter pallidus]